MTSKLAMRMHTIGFERRRRLKPILCAKSIIATVKFRLFLVRVRSIFQNVDRCIAAL